MAEIFAADIGGTNSRFARFASDKDNLELKETLCLKTKDAGSFPALLEGLRLSGFSLLPRDADIAVFAVAGPVVGGIRSTLPLAGFEVDISNPPVKTRLGRSILINDFIAQAYSCLTEPGKNAIPILSGAPSPDAAISVIGAGTGIGMASLMPDSKGGYTAFPSEGCHTDFPFTSDAESAFRKFLSDALRCGSITANMVVSGAGLRMLHRFLTGEALEPEGVAARFNDNPETLAWFSRFYGRACRNFALSTVSLGGVFVAGGIAAKSPEILINPAFGDEFSADNALSSLINNIPVYLIKDEDSGLWGAAFRGMIELNGK